MEEIFDDIGLVERLQHEQEKVQDENVQSSTYEEQDNPDAEDFDPTTWG